MREAAPGDMMTEPDAPEQPQARPAGKIYIGLDGIHVEFAEGFWDDPSHDLVLRDGRTMRNARIDELALLIASSLRKQVAGRLPAPSGLVGPAGRPL